MSRITLLLKPDKPSDNIDSYQPINNLSTIDKIIKLFLKDQITYFINDSTMILGDQYGSCRVYSKLTALSSMNHQLINNYHHGKVTADIQTDHSYTK